MVSQVHCILGYLEMFTQVGTQGLSACSGLTSNMGGGMIAVA